MIIRCTKCSTEFALDPSQVGPEGVTLRCSVCSHMFHAEPDPEAMPAPWKLGTADRTKLSLPDLRRVIEAIGDGRLKPDDQISHTGQTWVPLAEIPEFSALFRGVDGLPRVFRASEAPATPTPTPTPAADVRREETVRFNIGLGGGGSGARVPPRAAELDPLPAPPDFDTPLPAPPDFDNAPVSRRSRPSGMPEPRGFQGEPRKKAPASMLEAVTKAVAGGDDHDDAPEVEANRGRSSPILVADLARAATANAEKAVQAVDSQRRERARVEGEASLSGSLRPDSSKAATAAAVAAAMAVARERGDTGRIQLDRDLGRAPGRDTGRIPLDRPASERSPTVPLPTLGVERADRATPSSVIEPLREEPQASHSAAAAASATRPPEVVIVKVAEPGGRGSSAVLVALLGVVAAAAIVFGVPSIRERVMNLGQPEPVAKTDATKGTAAPESLPTQELALARTAMQRLGLKETDRGQAALQRVLDDPKRSPQAIAEVQLALAELVLMRALACQIAVALEPAAMGGQAQARSTEDPPVARDLLASLPAAPDEQQLRRVKALQSLVQGEPVGELPPGSEELAAWIRAAPLWRGQVPTPPTGLITALRSLPGTSTLTQSVLALAEWRSGDDGGARERLIKLVEQVPDQPVARTLLDALDRQGMLAENGDPETTVPADSGDPPSPQVRPPPGETPGKTTATPRPGTPVGAPPVPGESNQQQVEVMISSGCQKVRAGDPAGVKLLLDAVQRGANPSDNFNLCFCLGAGFARQNSHDTALTWYKRAVSQSPTNRDAVAGAARSAELLGRTSIAVDYYRKLRGLDPSNSAAAAYLAKHDNAATPDPTPQTPPDDPGELLPVKRKTP